MARGSERTKQLSVGSDIDRAMDFRTDRVTDLAADVRAKRRSAVELTRHSLSQIEALDMGRRGLHNEGSELLRERLEGKIEVDHDTARRLFTLICALHIKA